MLGSRSLSFLNSISIMDVWTIKPAFPYILITRSILFAKCLAVLDGRNLIITKLIPLNKVTKKGKPLTNITSATMVMYLCNSIKSRGLFT
jgi:hypothetical protein